MIEDVLALAVRLCIERCRRDDAPVLPRDKREGLPAGACARWASPTSFNKAIELTLAAASSRRALGSANMEAKNPGAGMYKHSVARLKEKGIPAYDAFTHFMDIVKLCRSNKFSFIAHNGLRFDQPMLDRCVKQLRGEDESFKLDTASGMYFDTMGLERGSQTKIMPTQSDDWYTFNHRLVYEGGRIFSSLDRHCSNKYNLVNKHSLEGSAHEADFDCRLTHHLFEEFREMAERGAAA